MKQKQWIRITEDTFDFLEGQIFAVERRENNGMIISDPDNPFNTDWVEDGVYEALKENPFS